VRPAGNPTARELIERVFEITDRRWRGMGEIEQGGLGLRAAYRHLDAEARFGTVGPAVGADVECISGSILRGVSKPPDCPAFATRCTPARPLGAPMVSAEGACRAYHRHRRGLSIQPSPPAAPPAARRGAGGILP
jgi:hydrogenase expression/formation protein HypD